MGEFDNFRHGDDIFVVNQLEPGDRMTPKPGAEVQGRHLYGSKWVVDEVLTNRVRLQRMSNGRREDEYITVSNNDLSEFDIYTTDQSSKFWSGYSKEGGHRIM